MTNKILVIAHQSCMDGTASAYAAWTKLGDTADYIYQNYYDAIPNLDGYEKIYILDFSYKRSVIEQWLSEGRNIQIIDHHKSAQKELEGLPCAYFDMTKSGAVLAWEYFNPGQPVPVVLLYIQDRDLWQWQLYKSRELNAYIRNQDFQLFKHFRNFVQSITDITSDNFYRCTGIGSQILKYEKRLVDYAVKRAYFVSFCGYDVPIVNSTVLGSEIGERLNQMYPDAKFAVVYRDLNKELRKFELRTQQKDFDTGQMLKDLGIGGGHAQASGCEILIKDLEKYIK